MWICISDAVGFVTKLQRKPKYRKRVVWIIPRCTGMNNNLARPSDMDVCALKTLYMPGGSGVHPGQTQAQVRIVSSRHSPVDTAPAAGFNVFPTNHQRSLKTTRPETVGVCHAATLDPPPREVGRGKPEGREPDVSRKDSPHSPLVPVKQSVYSTGTIPTHRCSHREHHLGMQSSTVW
jgi:hypothetical protein